MGPARADGAAHSNLAELDGTTGTISLGTSLAAAFLNQPAWSVECWFYTDVETLDAGTVVSGTYNNSNRVALQVYNNRLLAEGTVGGVTVRGSMVQPQITCWNHAVFTSRGELYVNGRRETGVSGATVANTTGVFIGQRTSATSYWNGAVSHVAFYNKVLPQDRVLTHFNAGAWNPPKKRGLLFQYGFENLGYPEYTLPGADVTGHLDQGATISSAQFHDGASSLSIGGGTFRACTFDNPSPFVKLADMEEGTVNGWFLYSGGSQSGMVLQLGTKDRGFWNDYNEGYKLTFNNTGAVFRCDYNGSTGFAQATVSTTITPGSWHWFECKWNKMGTPTLSVTIDAVNGTTNTAIGPFKGSAFHHLLLGNDTVSNNTSQHLDSVSLYGYWLP